MSEADLLQNTYLILIQKIGDFSGRTRQDYTRWVSRLVEHEIRRWNRWYSAKKRQAVLSSDSLDTLVCALRPRASTPSDELLRKEQVTLLREAFERLPEDYRKVLDLAVIGELTHSEIGVRLDRSAKATTMLLCRARAALKLAILNSSRQEEDEVRRSGGEISGTAGGWRSP